MFTLDWHNEQFYYLLAAAGALVIALSVALYAVPGGRLRVPGIALSIVGSLGAGLAAGVILMGMTGYKLPEEKEGAAAPEGGGPPPPPQMAGGGGMPRMGGIPGGPGGRGGGGPNPKAQLAALVNKLDVLTEKPLTVKLNEDQRKQVQEQLTGLADDNLSDDDAKKKLDKLLDVLKEQKGTLEAAGYQWPGEGGRGGGRGGPTGNLPGGGRGGRGGEPPPNPFKNEQNAEHLKHLTDRLAKS
jgi:hypothetical protein